MNLGNLLTPWIELAAVLIILIYVEKWIHSHLYGVGWLLTNDKKTATALYYLLLSPGVFVHEFTQYLVAGALNVKIKRVMAWPEAQEDGTLRLNFVQIKDANRLQAAVIGAIPFLVGLGLVWVISNHILNMEDLMAALAAADITLIGKAVQNLASTPDFYLWLYLMFAIGNAMLPTPADREGWPLLFAVFVVIIAILVIIGTGDVLLKTFTGPVAHGVDLLTTAFATVLVVEVSGIIIIGFAEEIAERITKRKFYYGKERAETRSRERQPGSSDPLPVGTPLPSIYNLPLPLPTPSEIRSARKPIRPALAAVPEVGAPTTARPPLPDRSSLAPREESTGEPSVRQAGSFAPSTRPPLDAPGDATPPPPGSGLSPRPRPFETAKDGDALSRVPSSPAGGLPPRRSPLDADDEDEDKPATSPLRSSRPALGGDALSRAPSSPAGGLAPRRSPLEPDDEDEDKPGPFRSSRPALGGDALSRAPSSPAGGLAPRRSPLESDDEDEDKPGPFRPSRPALGGDALSRAPSSPVGGLPPRRSPLEPDDEDETTSSPLSTARFSRPTAPSDTTARPPFSSPGGGAADRFPRSRPVPPLSLDDDEDEDNNDDDNEVEYIPIDDA
jgi:hypothetical protein